MRRRTLIAWAVISIALVIANVWLVIAHLAARDLFLAATFAACGVFLAWGAANDIKELKHAVR